MITRKEFALIDTEVKESLHEAFEYVKNNCVDHDYILFLADGEYQEKYKSSPLRLNPYTIDNKEDKFKDESRQNFFIKFMQTFYSFPKSRPRTDDNEFRLTMELMIYTHIWESKPILKQLYRLASLTDGKSYHWSVEVPEMSKHEFIRENIRDVLKNKKLRLADVITKGFHTSLRNAFAHSEYQFDNHNNLIHLDTFKGAKWDIKNISFNDWTKRFAYTSLLSYHFFNERVFRRRSLVDDFGKDNFLIIHPITETKFRTRTIFYEPKWNIFSFYK